MICVQQHKQMRNDNIETLKKVFMRNKRKKQTNRKLSITKYETKRERRRSFYKKGPNEGDYPLIH